ncbi:RNA polymerase sigma factor [Streptomyces sennicomposti]
MSRESITADQIRAAQAGDADAMWAIIQGCDAMLRGIVRTVAPHASREDAEDYLQEARAVLIQRIRDYDSDTSTAALTSYVYAAAKRAVTEAHIANTVPVTVPASAAIVVRHLLWRHAGNVEKVWEELESEKSTTHKISRDVFVALLEALAEGTSLDAPAGGEDADGSSLTLADVLADPSAEVTRNTERINLAHWLLTQISQRQALALRAFYGIGMARTGVPNVVGGVDKSTDEETAAHMGISTAALRKLRSRGVDSARAVAHAHGIEA